MVKSQVFGGTDFFKLGNTIRSRFGQFFAAKHLASHQLAMQSVICYSQCKTLTLWIWDLLVLARQ